MATLSVLRKNDADNAGLARARATVYDSVGVLPLAGNVQGDQAFIPGDSSTDLMYIWDGGGWYKMALIQTVPSFTTGPDATYDLATDGTTTTVITLAATDAEGIPVTFSVTANSDFNGLATVSQDSSVFTVTPKSEDSATTDSGTLTFKASDGISIASALSTFTLTFKVVNSNYTEALFKASGNNGVNQGIDDASSNNHTISRNGNAMVHPLSPYHPGGYSAYFDGNGDYIVPAITTAVGTNDFTLEGWFYFNSLSSDVTIFDFRSSGAWGIFSIFGSGGNARKLVYYNGSSNQGITTNTVPVGQWTHIAIVRASGVIKIYIDGLLGSTTSDNTSWTIASSPRIGANKGNSNYVYGYISDVRLVNGTAVYTAEFTPPTGRLEAITNTALLTAHLPYLADGSSNSHTVTFAGNVKIHRFGPYDYVYYDPSTHGSCVRFDGSGDFLTIGDTATTEFGSGDFTIELWYFGTDTDQYATLTSKGAGVFSSGNWSLMMNHSVTGDIALYVANYSTGAPMLITGDVNVTDGQWNHIALVRNGNNWNLYVNGVSKASRTSSITIADTSAGVYIGKDQYYGRDLSGFISDYRIVKGTAVYTSNFTPPTAPLTAISGTSYSTCNDHPNIYDAARGRTSLLAGNAKSSTAQTKYASSSIALDGTGDYVYIDKAVGHFGTRDFTVEGWWYFNTISAGYQPLVALGQSADQQGWVLITESNNTIAWYMSNGSSWTYNIGTSTVPTLNAWNHIAIVRKHGRIEMYLNGTSLGSNTSIGSNSTHTTNAGYLYAGHYPYFPGGARSFNGYIEDLRITKGLARYPFIKAKETLTAISGTSFLTAHAATITDGSSNSISITSQGDPTVSDFGPAVGMKSVLFDGNDYLQMADGDYKTFGSNDFTIEAWVYPTSVGSGFGNYIWGDTASSGATNTSSTAVLYNSSGKFGAYITVAGPTILDMSASSLTTPVNNWYHIALVRNGNTFSLFVDGVLSNSTTNSNAVLDSSQILTVGRTGAYNGLNFVGYVSNYRIVKGTALYTNSFTAPTAELKA